MSEKPRLLTIKLPPDMYAEFSASTAVMRERTMTALLHSFVKKAIREAREMVSDAEFKRTVEKHRQDIEARSKLQKKASKKGKVAVRTIELAKPLAKRRHG